MLSNEQACAVYKNHYRIEPDTIDRAIILLRIGHKPNTGLLLIEVSPVDSVSTHKYAQTHSETPQEMSTVAYGKNDS